MREKLDRETPTDYRYGHGNNEEGEFLFIPFKRVLHDILSHFFDGLNSGLSVEKPKHNGLLRKKNTKGVILKHKGTRTAQDGED